MELEPYSSFILIMQQNSKFRQKIILRIFVPFMLAYLLSELFRNVNGIVGSIIQSELSLNSKQLGSLTSIFFISVAAAQLFVGVLLDRFGGRRTVALLLLFCAVGSLIFSSGDLRLMYLGRFLIGLGVAGCWTAAFKTNAQWWPAEKLAFANGAIIGLAGIGALAATLPTQYLLNAISWQSMFVWCSVATIMVALILWFVAFDHPSDLVRNSRSFVDELKGFKAVFRNPVFLVFGPLSILGQGAWLSYQGLWAGAWLREVNNLSALSAAGFLFLLAICVVFGNIVLNSVVMSYQMCYCLSYYYIYRRCL